MWRLFSSSFHSESLVEAVLPEARGINDWGSHCVQNGPVVYWWCITFFSSTSNAQAYITTSSMSKLWCTTHFSDVGGNALLLHELVMHYLLSDSCRCATDASLSSPSLAGNALLNFVSYSDAQPCLSESVMHHLLLVASNALFSSVLYIKWCTTLDIRLNNPSRWCITQFSDNALLNFVLYSDAYTLFTHKPHDNKIIITIYTRSKR